MASQTTPQSESPQPASGAPATTTEPAEPTATAEPAEPTAAAQPAGPAAAAASGGTGPDATAGKTPQPSLWHHPDFLKLWGGQSISLIGTQVTVVALPLTAVLLLHATAGQMGLLGALARAPFALFLFAGVWADRFRRRPTMIVTDLGRGLLIALIPALFLAGALNMTALYPIVFIVGALGVLFETANQSFIPSLVDRELVPEANAKFQISQSVAQVGGPGLAGLLVTVFSAASIIVIDAVSYFVGAVASFMIRKPEARPGGTSKPPKVFAAIGAGLKWVWVQPVIRPMMFATAFYMTFAAGIQALYALYLRDSLHLSGTWIGLTFAFLGVGAIAGSLLSLRILRRTGPGPAAFWATVIGNAAFLLIPFAAGPTWVKVAMLAAAQIFIGMSGPIAQVGMGSLRMVLTPNEMQGRVVATFRGLSLGLAPVGALFGGLLAEAVGLRPTLIVFAVGVLVPIFVMLFSPIPGTRSFPQPAGK
ncbi:MAG TPA: MFS transporter [Streptosporangiaceae bacterium]|nr:MFS transporter [Streptosporangiaceae bacterium]